MLFLNVELLAHRILPEGLWRLIPTDIRGVKYLNTGKEPSFSYFWNWNKDFSQISTKIFLMMHLTTQTLLCYVLPLHLVVPWVTIQQTRVLHVRWNIGKYSQHKKDKFIEKQLFMFLCSTLFLPCVCVPVLKAVLESPIFLYRKNHVFLVAYNPLNLCSTFFPPSLTLFSLRHLA